MLYAILIAFTLWKALTDHDGLRNILRDEANKIRAISAFLKFFDNVAEEDLKDSHRTTFYSLHDMAVYGCDNCHGSACNGFKKYNCTASVYKGSRRP
jgi:hypothetical protein